MNAAAPAGSLEVRGRLVEALGLDLVGPGAGHGLADERLPRRERPSNWYLTGFLIPSGTPRDARADADEDDDFADVPESAGLAEESTEDRKAAKKAYFPSSMGLSFLVAADARKLAVTVRWGDYAPAEIGGGDGRAERIWQRTPREVAVPAALDGLEETTVLAVPGSGGLELHVVERPIRGEDMAGRIPDGTRSVSIFLVNHRPSDADVPDRAYVFQAQIEVQGDRPFVPRPDPRGAGAADWDDRVADLHYAGTPEYATGHGVSAEWKVEDGVCRRIATAWIPRAEVEKTDTVEVPGAELAMEKLGALDGGAAARAALGPLVERYRDWIEKRRGEAAALDGEHRETAEELLRLAEVAADRIADGIDLLARENDGNALDAFRTANRAVARALRKRRGITEPRWRAFQLAFLLLNLPGLAGPHDRHRETVDLLFFPTGGGKTEAYLGLAAFAMVLRRLRHPGADRLGGAGVSVIMRYTLRLLTLDQLARASGLVCALELERERDPERYGTWPFEIGLWVGKAATPNALGHIGEKRQDTARSKVRHYKNDPEGEAVADPARELPLVRQPVHRGLVRAAARRRPTARAAHRLHETRVRLHPRPGVADRRRRRADLPAAAGVPDRHRRQVRVAPLGR